MRILSEKFGPGDEANYYSIINTEWTETKLFYGYNCWFSVQYDSSEVDSFTR